MITFLKQTFVMFVAAIFVASSISAAEISAQDVDKDGTLKQIETVVQGDENTDPVFTKIGEGLQTAHGSVAKSRGEGQYLLFPQKNKLRAILVTDIEEESCVAVLTAPHQEWYEVEINTEEAKLLVGVETSERDDDLWAVCTSTSVVFHGLPIDDNVGPTGPKNCVAYDRYSNPYRVACP